MFISWFCLFSFNKKGLKSISYWSSGTLPLTPVGKMEYLGFGSFSRCFPGVKASQKWWCQLPNLQGFHSFFISWCGCLSLPCLSVPDTITFFMVELDVSHWDEYKTSLKMNSSNVWFIPKHLISEMNDEELLVWKSSLSGGILPRKSTISKTVVDLKTPECWCSSEMLN